MGKIKLVGSYIGPDKIVKTRISERKTYLGREVTEIEFKNKKRKEFPTEDLGAIVTKEVSDKTRLRELQMIPIATKLLGILADSELPMFSPVDASIHYLLETVIPESIKANERKAYGLVFNKDYYEINLVDLDGILTKDGKGKETDKN